MQGMLPAAGPKVQAWIVVLGLTLLAGCVDPTIYRPDRTAPLERRAIQAEVDLRHLEAAELYRQLEQYEAAAECFSKLNDFGPAAEMFQLGGLREEAAQHFERASRFAEAAEARGMRGDPGREHIVVATTEFRGGPGDSWWVGSMWGRQNRLRQS